jgi:polypeptide N-acetylgalactosaminyltransferase
MTASVIICFHNEAWSVLLRSVYSVINRSPAHLLKEILLVDDFSDQEHVLKKLDDYIEYNFKGRVKVLRNKRREGLIRTRLFGAKVATGNVLIFLDSHIEATDGWLEPLIAEISRNETVVVTPMIDIIDKDTFEYKYSKNSRVSVGGFDWNLHFTWVSIKYTCISCSFNFLKFY